MQYSLDFRQQVIEYIESGGKIKKASEVFGIGRATIYRWLARENLEGTKVKRRDRKLDWSALEKDVSENPNTKLVDRAKKFGVHPSSLCYAFGELKITRKKKELRYRERDEEERDSYRIKLSDAIAINGIESLVFIDESGFDEIESCRYGWSKRGAKLYGDKQGRRVMRDNLVAGRRKNIKDLLAPMLFRGSLNAEGFEGWLELYLLPSLVRGSVLIMDNAPIHRKRAVKELVESRGHQVLFLPKYSPDLNDIEHDFSALKRARMYAPEGISIDEIICDYCTS